MLFMEVIMKRYTVKSWTKMDCHPTQNMDLVDEMYFNTLDECEEWGKSQEDAIELNFEVHLTVGAKNYLHGEGLKTGSILWKIKDYPRNETPLIACWWSMLDPPFQIFRT